MIKKPKRPSRSINIYYFLPIILFRYLFDKIFNTYISISTKYNIISGKYFTDKGFGFKNKFKCKRKLKIKDITNKKIRYSLYLTSLFKPWHIYLMNEGKDTTTDLNKRESIYISRDKLEPGDFYTGERINEFYFNKLFKPKYRKQRRKLGVYKYIDHYKLEPQFYVVIIKYTDLQYKLKEYYSARYKYKKEKELKKAVNLAIKTSIFNSRRSFTGKLGGTSLIEHLLHEKEYDYLHEIYGSLDEYDKERFVDILEQYVYEENINDERKEYIKQFS